MNSMISVKGLQKYYKDHHVLKGVDFEVATGEIFCLLGSNGAGKTTCVNILTTLGAADAGTTSINGHDVASDPKGVRESISLTGQFAATDEMLTGRENLRIIASLRRIRPKAKAQQQVDSLLEAFRLTDAADKPVSTYSGGMRRRLDIAMTLLGNSPVIFLDEPTTGLDPQNRIAMWDLIKGMAADGTTIVLTTQYLEEAQQLADQVAILHEGVIIAKDSPQGLRESMACAHTGEIPVLEDVFLALIGEKDISPARDTDPANNPSPMRDTDPANNKGARNNA